MISKIVKHNKLLAWLIILAFGFSLAGQVWSDESETPTPTPTPEQEQVPMGAHDLPLRAEDALFAQMELFADTGEGGLELRVLQGYPYTAIEQATEWVEFYDENGEPALYDFGMYAEGDVIRIYDADGEFVDEKEYNFMDFSSVREEPDESGAESGDEAPRMLLTYRREVPVEVEKVRNEVLFAVKNKQNDFIWWSSPINGVYDGQQVSQLASPIAFTSGDPGDYGKIETVYSDSIIANACQSVDKLDNGARFNFYFTDRATRLSMEVTLESDGGILVTVPQSSIVEDNTTSNEGSAMLTLSLLSSFGAGHSSETGYVVVPDGSGAVINFNNGKPSSRQYAAQVYGRDYAVSQRFNPPVTQQVSLPVYGIVRDNGANALVAIAEKGDENAIIRAAVAGQNINTVSQLLGLNDFANTTAYNLAWFDFRTRTVDEFYIGTSNTPLKIFESGQIKTGDIAVRYYPLAASADGELSYVDVAHTYRDYLTLHKGVQPKQTDGLPFYMSIGGGTVKTRSILGFPFDMQTSATTYSQAQEMVETLKSRGVDNFVITYNDFNTARIKGRVSPTVQYSSMLGGKKAFGRLLDAVGESNGVLFPAVGFMEYYESGGGYSYLRHSSREVTRSRAIQQKYELAFGTPDKMQDPYTILSPYYFTGAFNKLVKSLQKEKITTISLESATSLLYSDFSRKNPYGSSYFNRRDTVQILTEGFKKLNDAGISIMAQSANAYAFPYVSHISDVPLSSSNFDVFDYDIPFYQIVLSGLIPYSTTPFNASANLNALTLLSLSTATPVHYEFIYKSPGSFSGSDYNAKFYANYSGWLNDAANTYAMFNGLMGGTANEKIIGHRQLEDGGTETEFEGGKRVYINLDTYEIRIDGVTVELNQYKTGGGA